MTYSSTILADSPIAYWPLGEPSGTAADNAEGTAALDGTYVNTPTLGVTGAVTGTTAVTFAAASLEHVTIPDNAVWDIGTGDYSIEFWAAGLDAILSSAFILSFANEIEAWTDGDNLQSRVAGVGTAYVTSGRCDSDASWHHWVVSIDRNVGGQWYKDGATSGSSADISTAVSLSIAPAGTGYIARRDAGNYFDGSLQHVAVYNVALTSGQVAAHYAARAVSTPTWTTPADAVSMSTTPELKFTSPTSAVAQHFQLQLDTANTFDTGNLRTYDSSTDQTNWAFWDGGAWTALPAGGLSTAYDGNEIRYTVTSALSGATWYRRVRAGTLV